MIASLRRRVAPALKTAGFHGGAYAALRRLMPSRGVAILRYHAICGPEGHAYASPWICMSPADFERQVAYLTSRYRVMPLPEVAAAMSAGRTLPPNAMVFTFDDGYADNLQAARILAKYGASGTFYITAGCLQGGETFWVSEARYLVSHLRRPVTLVSRGWQVIVDPAASDAVRVVNRLFKSVTIPEREELRERLREAAAVPPMPSPMLTWEQVREMHALGMTIGSHTMTHPNLPSAGLKDATRELREAKNRLEAEVGVPVTMFSYPNGGAERYYTPELRRVVADAGYACATTSQDGVAGPSSDLYALERVSVSERLPELLFRLEVERFAFRPTGRGGATE